jgi:hypothetical protein
VIMLAISYQLSAISGRLVGWSGMLLTADR